LATVDAVVVSVLTLPTLADAPVLAVAVEAVPVCPAEVVPLPEEPHAASARPQSTSANSALTYPTYPCRVPSM